MATFSSLTNAKTEYTAIILQYYNMMMSFYYICQLSIRYLHIFRDEMKKLQIFFNFHLNIKYLGICIESYGKISDISL